jgi:hypothetical protein
MTDKPTRMLEAERALQSLDIRIEQYCVHLEELAAHPQEAEKARAVLEEMTTERARQKNYCDLLANAELAEGLSERSGSRAA